MNDLQQYWKLCLDMLSADLTKSAFTTWFAPIVPVSFENNTLAIQVPSHMVRNYIEENYIDLFAKVLRQVFGPINLEYRVLIDSHSGVGAPMSSDRFEQSKTKQDVFGQNDAVSYSDVAEQPSLLTGYNRPVSPKAQPAFDSRLRSDYTFESFVQGDCNRLTRSVSLTAAKDPGKSTFNPLFIYGGSGVGKTHLLNAIGNQVLQLYPDKRVLYISANEFKTQFMSAARNHQVDSFVQYYQTIDVLLIDDIQFLAGQNLQTTQNQFFHIFNYLHQSQKQIVMTSDRPPLEIKDLEDRLLTRFKWNFQGELGRPDFALRKDILRNKIMRDGVDLPDEVIAFIAENVRDNVRDLEGVIASLLAYSMVMDSDIDIQLAERVIGNIVDMAPSEINIDDIVQVVAAEFSVDPQTLYSKSRLKEISMARQVSMYFAKEMTGKSLQEIGNHFNRTHATVINAIEVVTNTISVDPLYKRHILKIENKLRK